MAVGVSIYWTILLLATGQSLKRKAVFIFNKSGEMCPINRGQSTWSFLTDVLVQFQAFSKKKTDDRKEWLTNFMEDRRQRRMHGLPEVRLHKFHSFNRLLCSFLARPLWPICFNSLIRYLVFILFCLKHKHMSIGVI